MEKVTKEGITSFIANQRIKFAPSQGRLCLPIINRICQKMSNGLKFDDIKICEGLVIDGHHRYLSALLTNFQISTVLGNMTIATKEFSWEEVEIDEDDWDTPVKIQMLNEQDAKYNTLDIEAIKEMIAKLE